MAIGHGTEVVHDVKTDYYGQHLATASSDTTVKIIAMSNNSSLKPLATLLGHRGPVLQVTWAHTQSLARFFVFLWLQGQGDDLEGGQSE